jgi:hypothetical protein
MAAIGRAMLKPRPARASLKLARSSGIVERIALHLQIVRDCCPIVRHASCHLAARAGTLTIASESNSRGLA